MSKNTKLIISIVIAVALFIAALLLYSALSEDFDANNMAGNSNTSSNNTNKDDSQDYSAPDFIVTDSDGSEVTLSQFFSKPIVLNMWASWCSPCKNEMPYFEEAYKENEDIQFMMVNMTAGDSKKDAKEFIKEEGYTFPVFFDEQGYCQSVYGATSLPMTIFIDKNGDIVTYAVGALSAEQLQKGIDLIKE